MPEQKQIMNVLWLVSWYPHENNISLGDFIQRQAVAASKYCAITVVGFFPKKGITEICKEEKKYSNQFAEIIFYYPDKGNGWLRKYYHFWYICKAAIRFYKSGIRIQRPHLIHLHVLYPLALIAMWYAMMLRVPLVVSEHASAYFRDYKATAHFMRRLVDRFVVKRSAAIVVVSETLQEAMASQGLSGHFCIIPNVVDGLFLNPAEKISKNISIFQWIHTSTLAEGIKDIEGILEAVQLLTQIRQDFFMTFIGGTNYLAKKYTAKATDLGISKFVVFIPEIPQNDVVKFLQNSDAYIHFSKMETFGLSVVEALSAGLPCIATRTGIFEQWINAHTGILVESGNITQLTHALVAMMEKYDSYDLTNIGHQIEACYSTDVVGRKMAGLYEEILNI